MVFSALMQCKYFHLNRSGNPLNRLMGVDLVYFSSETPLFLPESTWMILKRHRLQFWVRFYFLCHIFNLFPFYCSFYFPMFHYCFFFNIFLFLLVCFFLCIFLLNSFYYFKVFITGHPEALEYFFSNCLLPDEGWYFYQVIKRETSSYFKKFIYLQI